MYYFIERSSHYFYTDILMCISAILCLLIGIIRRNIFLELKWLFFYPLMALVECIVGYSFYFINISENSYDITVNIVINIFLLIEFFSLFIFYNKNIKNVILKKWLMIAVSFYVIIISFIWLFVRSPFLYPAEYFFIQSVFVLILGIISIIDFFRGKLGLNLLNEPSLWITTGTLLYFLCTIPLYLAKEFILDERGYIHEPALYSINYICYCILFLLIIRAYLCSPIEKSSNS